MLSRYEQHRRAPDARSLAIAVMAGAAIAGAYPGTSMAAVGVLIALAVLCYGLALYME